MDPWWHLTIRWESWQTDSMCVKWKLLRGGKMRKEEMREEMNNYIEGSDQFQEDWKKMKARKEKMSFSFQPESGFY